MKTCEAIIIGGSAGSLEVLLKMLQFLKEKINFAIIIVIHRRPGADQVLKEVLAIRTSIPVKEAEEKEKIMKGVIYLAPADYHLLIEIAGTFSLDHSEKINYSRPSIDATFESAAEVYKERLVGILLSGANADGVTGLSRIKKLGGRVVIQDPETARVPYMPSQAALHVDYDELLEAEKIAEWINQL